MKLDKLTKTKMICEIKNLPMSVKDCAYYPNQAVLFVLLTETNMMSKLGAFISSFSNPATKEELSSVVAYKEDPPGSLEFSKLWKKNFDYEVKIFIWKQGLIMHRLLYFVGMMVSLSLL